MASGAPSKRVKTKLLISGELALAKIQKAEMAALDTQQAFLIYASFSGDVDQTAAALDIPSAQVAQMAEDQGWRPRIATLVSLKRAGNARDVERGINRAQNFVQAHRFRLVLERLIRRFSEMDDVELANASMTRIEHKNKDGSLDYIEHKINSRAFADLASAVEKAQMLSYYALGDSATERNHRTKEEEPTEVSIQDIHATIAEAMAKSAREAQAAQAVPRAPLAPPPGTEPPPGTAGNP